MLLFQTQTRVFSILSKLPSLSSLLPPPPSDSKKRSEFEGGPERATFIDSDTTHQFSTNFQGNCLYSTVPQHGRQMFKKLSVYTLTSMEFEKFNAKIEPCIWG